MGAQPPWYMIHAFLLYASTCSSVTVLSQLSKDPGVAEFLKVWSLLVPTVISWQYDQQLYSSSFKTKLLLSHSKVYSPLYAVIRSSKTLSCCYCIDQLSTGRQHVRLHTRLLMVIFMWIINKPTPRFEELLNTWAWFLEVDAKLGSKFSG